MALRFSSVMGRAEFAVTPIGRSRNSMFSISLVTGAATKDDAATPYLINSYDRFSVLPQSLDTDKEELKIKLPFFYDSYYCFFRIYRRPI